MKRRTARAAAEAAAAKIEPTTERLRVEYLPLAALARWPRNPKLHDEEGVDASMTRFGYADPITIDEKSGRIVAGHGRLDVLLRRRAEGREPPARVELVEGGRDWLVPVLRGVSFRSSAEAEAYLIAHNQLGPSGGYDDRMLVSMLAEHKESEAGLVGTGWSDEQVRDMIAAMERASAPLGDDAPPEEFDAHDANERKTVNCPRCGFHVVID